METKKLSLSEIVETEGWKKFMNRIGILAPIAFIIGLLEYLLNRNSQYSTYLISMGLSLMAVLYFFTGCNNFKSYSKILTFWVYKIYGWGLSLFYTTLLFKLMHWSFPIAFWITVLPVFISILLGISINNKEKSSQIDWKYFLSLFTAIIVFIYAYLNIK